MDLMPFDELNSLEDRIKAMFPDGKLVNADGNFVKSDLYDVIDMMLDLFLLAYAQGNSVTNANLASELLGQYELDLIKQTITAAYRTLRA
mgnify:CR=1 FL=1